MTHTAMTGPASLVRPGDGVADPAACSLTFSVRSFRLRTSPTGLVRLFGSLPFRQLAGPAAVFFCWPPRPARTASGAITPLSRRHRTSIGTRQPAGRMPL
jgi:hypothetical protein